MDRMIRGTDLNYQVRILAANTTQLVNEAASKHQTTPVVTAALGRLLTGGLLMGMTMKNQEDLLTIQIKGDGPIGGLLVTADSLGHVKGYPVNTQVELPLKSNGKLDVSGAVGKGMLQVIKDMGMKEAYTGQTELVSGEIAEDLTYYYYYSEQTPSIIALGVLVDVDYTVKHAGGIMIQLMPNAEDFVVELLEKNVKEISSITNLFQKGQTLEEIVNTFIKGLTFHKLDELVPEFRCDCTKEKVEKILISLGKEEIQEMITDQKPVEMTCHFCNENYLFTKNDLVKIVEKL